MKDRTSTWITAAKVIFAITYTAVVVPFTMSFIFALSAVKFGIAQQYAIPALLIMLELVSVGIAISFWRARGFSARAGTISLFLICQLLAVVSTFHHLRLQDFHKEKKAFGEAQRTRGQAMSDQIAGLTRSVSDINAAQANTNNILHGDDEFIAKVLGTGDTTTTQERIAVSRSRGRLARDRERERRGFIGKRESLIAERSRLQVQLAEMRSQSVEPAYLQSPIDYIVGRWDEPRSWFALLVAMLFPITALGVAHQLASLRANQQQTSLEVQRLISIAEKAPKGYQMVFARNIASTVRTFLEGSRCSRTIFHEGVKTQLEISEIQGMIAQFKELEQGINHSKLSSEVKDYLLSTLSTMIDRQLRKEHSDDNGSFVDGRQFSKTEHARQ